MKWINASNVEFTRGNYLRCIFKFDNSKVWFNIEAITTTPNIRTAAREMGKKYGAKTVTVKYLFDDNDEPTEKREDVIDFYRYDGQYTFRLEIPVAEGQRRQFKYFDEAELFV